MNSTKSSWESFSRSQKLAAVTANALTVSRPILTAIVSKRGLETSHDWTYNDTHLLAAAYLTDLEGGIARIANAQTQLGAVLDPLADKIATNIQEATLAYRQEECLDTFVIKLARDIGVSALRKYALKQTDGAALVSAGWYGKANTAFRKTVTTFATSPLGEKYPKARRTLQLTSAATTAISGIAAARHIVKQLPPKSTPKKDTL